MIISKVQAEILSAYILKHGTKKEESGEVLEILRRKFDSNEPPLEEEIMGVLNQHGGKLTCFDCGRELIEAELIRGKRKEKLVAELYLDPGESNYPREPDIPAAVYFICAGCIKEKERQRGVLLDRESSRAALLSRLSEDGMSVQDSTESTCEGVLSLPGGRSVRLD